MAKTRAASVRVERGGRPTSESRRAPLRVVVARAGILCDLSHTARRRAASSSLSALAYTAMRRARGRRARPGARQRSRRRGRVPRCLGCNGGAGGRTRLFRIRACGAGARVRGARGVGIGSRSETRGTRGELTGAEGAGFARRTCRITSTRPVSSSLASASTATRGGRRSAARAAEHAVGAIGRGARTSSAARRRVHGTRVAGGDCARRVVMRGGGPGVERCAGRC